MCGIVGLIAPDPEHGIRPALAAIEHRGRDDEGLFVSAPFGSRELKTCLGHKRLSIIDTSAAGHQPMLSEDGRYSITFNGEIYNYLELRSELGSHGETFRTTTDTEV